MCDAMKKNISEKKCFLIDGYPRELEQGTRFEKEVIPVLLSYRYLLVYPVIGSNCLAHFIVLSTPIMTANSSELF